jgi:chorismate mutase
LNCVSKNGVNILTIHQSIPVNGIASLTLSIEIPSQFEDTAIIFEDIEALEGIHYTKILARE